MASPTPLTPTPLVWTRVEDNWPAFSTVWAVQSPIGFFTIRWNVLEKQHDGQPTYWLFHEEERTVFSGTVPALKLKLEEILHGTRRPKHASVRRSQKRD